MNVLPAGERVPSRNKILYTEKDITKDEKALAELQEHGYMTTPITFVGREMVIGYDEQKLKQLLDLK